MMDEMEDRLFRSDAGPSQVSKFQVELSNGVAVEYLANRPGCGDGLLFLHGIGGNAQDWLPLMTRLSSWRRAVAWNAPGYGASEDVVPDVPAVSDYVDRLTWFVDAIALSNIALVAHSWGALIASAFVKRNEARVRSLALLGPSIGLRNYAPEDRANLLRARLDEINSLGLDGWTAASARRLLARTASKDLICSIARPNPALRLGGVRQATYLLATADPVADIADTRTPLFVAYGEDDRVTPASFADQFRSARPDARLEIIPACGHLPVLEKPKETLSLLESFWSN